MRVLVTGASGAIGSRLVPQLIAAGHDVIGAARSPRGIERLRAMGAEAVTVDLLDPKAVRRAVLNTRPEAIIHEATALQGLKFQRKIDNTFRLTNQLRTKGTDNLLAAAREAGVTRFIAQSYAPLIYAREGSLVKSESDPLDMTPVASMRETSEAIRYLEGRVRVNGGIALRYGSFYGNPNDSVIEAIRKRQFPIVASGSGVTSFIHLEDAAAATVLALEHGKPGIYNIVDDDPAPMAEWLPILAEAVGAKPPRHVPRWLAKLFAGDVGVILGTEARGASNAKARAELGWTPRYPSWRQGFEATFSRAGQPAAGKSQPSHA